MMCTTQLEASTLAVVTCALLMNTPVLLTVALSSLMNNRDDLAVGEVGGVHGAGHDVVREHRVELGLVLRLEEVGDDAGGERSEGLVSGREHGERASARERGGQAS